MTAEFPNQLDLLRAYLTSFSRRPGADEWHVIAYADEISDSDLASLLQLAGEQHLGSKAPRMGHFNLVHLSFPELKDALLVVGRYAMRVGGLTELFVFGPSGTDGEIEFKGGRSPLEVCIGSNLSPQHPMPDDRRRVGPTERVASVRVDLRHAFKVSNAP